MTRRKGVSAEKDIGMQALVDAKTEIVTLVGKSWDLHVKDILNVSEAENLAMIRDSVAYLRSEGRRVIYDAEHFFDGFHRNPDFALATIRAAQEGGAETRRAVRYERRQPARADRGGRGGGTKSPFDSGRHSLPQRLRRGDGQFAQGRAARCRSGAGDHQRDRRTVRKRRLDQRGRQSWS